MINSAPKEYYRENYGVHLSYYIANRDKQDAKLNRILIFFILSVLFAIIFLSKPIFANNNINIKDTGQTIAIEKNFKENIEHKYANGYINYPTKGIAHIKKTKYINSRPIKINIVEINTNVNPNLKIKPQLASEKLNNKATVRKIATEENAIIAINGGFFKPQTGTPLGALMIDREILTGPIYNRVGIAIFNNENKTNFKMANIDFNINLKVDNEIIKIDNINQPRMLSTYKLIYTPDWGKYSPLPAKNGYNLLIKNNKPMLISSNAVELQENSFVIQAPKEIIKKLYKSNKIDYSIELQEELKEADHIIGAGPYLVKNSKIYIDDKTQKLQAIAGKNPRSAIGFNNEGMLVIVTVDGREENSVGMTLVELAKLMKFLGCEFAMNFDGGSSSAMYINGRIVNSAINKEGIKISNALIIKEENEFQISSL